MAHFDPIKKRGKKLDRLIKGLIVGGAIGSVIGITLAPKSGKETRGIIKERSKGLLKTAKDTSKELNRKARRNPISTLIRGAKTFIFGKKTKK